MFEASAPAQPTVIDRLVRAVYATAWRIIASAAPYLLRRRLSKGRELPERWREKLGEASEVRQEGQLVWLHGVGLGESMALRGLIHALSAQAPDLCFLVTSSTRNAAEVFTRNLPARTVHQFLPLDAATFLDRFLDHWRPNFVIWSEQDIWPNAIFAVAARGIPQALVNARITAQSYSRRRYLAPLYRTAFGCLSLIDAQDAATAGRLERLGVRKTVSVSGSLKTAGRPLQVDEEELAALRGALDGRRIWVVASSHAGDEKEAIAAMRELDGSEWLLILVPRDVSRAESVAQSLTSAGLVFARRSRGQVPGRDTRVWFADTYGEMGLWYRLAEVALIGGGFDAVGGHNPWEAVQLGTAILHGPDTMNFLGDYARLDAAGAARQIASGGLAQALREHNEVCAMTMRAEAVMAQDSTRVAELATRLCVLIGKPR